ncbi:cytochrome P450 3A8-like, partial [Oppia nitens]|uniref:cytochrome P450 3A8-like n=1 Tax=Oppia nitens TaxID=1686743 RepID=UPI0023DCE2AB
YDYRVITGTLLIILLYTIYSYIRCRQTGPDYWQKQGVKSVQVSLWSKFTKKWSDLELDLYRQNGRLFGVHELQRPVLFVGEPELIRDILVKDFHIFNARRDFRTGSNPLFDNQLTFVDYHDWQRIRYAMSPTFSTGKLRGMMPMIRDCVHRMDRNLRKIADNGVDDSDLKLVFGAYSMEVICQVAFGVRVDALNDPTNPLIACSRRIFRRKFNPKAIIIFLMPVLAKVFKYTFIDDDVSDVFQQFARKLIDERQQQNSMTTITADGAGKRLDFLQIMLDSTDDSVVKLTAKDIEEDIGEDLKSENNSEKYREFDGKFEKKITTDELVSQCMLFLLAAYETTASTVSFILYNLANNPECQQKLYNEIADYYRQHADLDYDSLNSLNYLDAVIKETKRYNSVALFLERTASQDYTTRPLTGGGTGIRIRKGDLVHIPLYAIHRDPDHFADPDQFKPDRFMPGNLNHHPYAYLPFGAGPRACIGRRLALMELKMAVQHAVYNYRFFPSNKPIEYTFGGAQIVPKEIYLRVEKR